MSKKNIIDRINSIAGEYPPETVFQDWVKCMAISWQNSFTFIHDKVWKEREEQYLLTLKKYNPEIVKEFCEMHGDLVMTFEEEMADVLGQIYMEIECANKTLGQFFTPFHVSKLTADLTAGEVDGSEKIAINEPSCGSGGMIIGFAKSLKERGINYQRLLRVTAQDLDWRSVYMTYVQMCILGINAKVVQMDTLRAGKPEKACVLYTPKRMGVIF